MKKTIELYRREFESSSGKTPQFMEFCRCFKQEFGKLLKGLGCTDIEIHIGHFYLMGFFKKGEQWWYFNTGDVRLKLVDGSMLIRTAENNKDYTGGINRSACMGTEENFRETIQRIIN